MQHLFLLVAPQQPNKLESRRMDKKVITKANTMTPPEPSGYQMSLVFIQL